MKILAAVNSTDDAYNALRSACRLARRIGYSVVAFYVDRAELYTEEFTRWPTVKRRIETEHDILAKEVIKKSYNIGRELGAAIEVVMSNGDPAREIVDYAYENGVVKLITMGHGVLGGAAENIVESVVKTVISELNKPVLVISNEREIKSILVIIETNYDIRGGNAVVRYVGTLARSLGARVGLVCLIPDLLAIAVDYGHIGEVPYIRERRSFRRFERLYKEKTQIIISEFRQHLAGMNVEVEADVKETDDVGEVIAQAHEYDLIAIWPKQKGNQGSFTEASKNLLNCHWLNTLFVQ
ncbi:MAG: universal stress protein [Nitrospirae bacterium]|nr:universal stress protein [Nitrospirota bacterium]